MITRWPIRIRLTVAFGVLMALVLTGIGVVTVRLSPVQSETSDPIVNPQSGAVYNRQFSGRGTDTDIVVASGHAYLNAVNRVLAAQETAAIHRWPRCRPSEIACMWKPPTVSHSPMPRRPDVDS